MKTTLILIVLFSFNKLSVASQKQININEIHIKNMILKNKIKVNKRVVTSIMNASKRYNINPEILTAIGIVESRLGEHKTVNVNKNGTTDNGIWQINDVSKAKCVEYNLNSVEGSSYCAAKLLASLKETRSDYVGAYHSKTPSKKKIYLNKIRKVTSL